MKNNIIFLTIITAISFVFACDDQESKDNSEPLAGSEQMAGMDMAGAESAGIPVQHMDFDTMDIEVDPDFAGLDTDMD